MWPRRAHRRETTDRLEELAEATAGVVVLAALSTAVKRLVQLGGGPPAPGTPSVSFEGAHGPKHQTLRMAYWILAFHQPTSEGGKVFDMG